MTALEVRAHGASKFGVLFTASLVSSLTVLDSEKPAARRVLRAAGGTASSHAEASRAEKRLPCQFVDCRDPL
jgi:hypothetical protein